MWKKCKYFKRHFLFVCYLSLSIFSLRSRKNECSALRGWSPLANRYHSRKHRINRETSKAKKKEVSYAEAWKEKLLQSTTHRTTLKWREHFNVPTKRSALMVLRVGLEYKFLSTLMRDTYVPNFTEISTCKLLSEVLKINAWMMLAVAVKQGPYKQRFQIEISVKTIGYSVKFDVRKK